MIEFFAADITANTRANFFVQRFLRPFVLRHLIKAVATIYAIRFDAYTEGFRLQDEFWR
jgi:hypothetical protein